MAESQSAAPESARPTPSGFVRRWRPLLLGLMLLGLAGLGLCLGFLWRLDQQLSERAEAMRLLKIKGYGWASESLKRIAERNDRDVEVIRELALGSFKSYFLPDAEKYLKIGRAHV